MERFNLEGVRERLVAGEPTTVTVVWRLPLEAVSQTVAEEVRESLLAVLVPGTGHANNLRVTREPAPVPPETVPAEG